MVLNAGLGVCDALVEGRRGSFTSVMVHSVHNNIVPHIATPSGLFGCDVRPRLTLLFPACLSQTVLLLSCVSRASTGLFKPGAAVYPAGPSGPYARTHRRGGEVERYARPRFTLCPGWAFGTPYFLEVRQG